MLVRKIERASLLSTLEAVSAGLAQRETVEQGNAFIFRNGFVRTFNEEVSCRIQSGLPKDFTGAVKFKSFMELLRKIKDEEISLEVDGGALVIAGGNGRRTARLNMDKEITIPLDQLEKPGEWNAMAEDFGDAINIVQGCAGKDASQFVSTCVHVHPKWVEATDGFQLARYRTVTGVQSPAIVRKEAIKSLVSLDMTEVSETGSWLHFKNPAGLVVSVRRYVEEYPSLKEHLQVEGTSAELPKGLASAIDVAKIFSKENADSDLLQIKLEPGIITVTGIGVSGEFTERKKLKYEGRSMKFTIPPEILTEIASKYNECMVTPTRLKVGSGKWTYVTTLGQVEPPKIDDAPKRTKKKPEEVSDE